MIEHPMRNHGLRKSFQFALAGIGYLFRTQPNARVHLLIAACVCAMAGWLRVSRFEWSLLILASALVLALEGVNTAVEALVDLASPQIHPLAKAAKDVAAGMVLLSAIASAVLGLLILGPPLIDRLTQ